MPEIAPRDFGPAFEDYLRSMLPRVRAALLAEAGAFLLARNAARSPVGDPPMDPHPGKMAASWRGSIGDPVAANLSDAPSYPRPSDDRMEHVPALSGSRPGESVHVTNDAKSDRDDYPYSYRMGVLGESAKAPEGTVLPSFADLAAEWDAVAAAAIERALAEGER